jgi:hypothetical protein
MADGDRSDPLDRLTDEIRRIADLLEARIAPALERLADSAGIAGGVSRDAGGLAAIRRALRAGELREADNLISDLESAGFDESDLHAIREEFARARDARVDELRSRLDASRHVNDHETALDLEEELSTWLDPATRRDVRTELLRWLMGLLMKRMRGGTVGVDVAVLAARIAGRFGDTAEGASLRASLPTLRRSAGLCARCGEPYAGIDDACPRCLGPQTGSDATPEAQNATPEASG